MSVLSLGRGYREGSHPVIVAGEIHCLKRRTQKSKDGISPFTENPARDSF